MRIQKVRAFEAPARVASEEPTWPVPYDFQTSSNMVGENTDPAIGQNWPWETSYRLYGPWC